MHQKQKISKKERRLLRQQGVIVENALNSMPTITPLTLNQKKAFEAYKKNKNIILHGTAGTGKTFVAFYQKFLNLNIIIKWSLLDPLFHPEKWDSYPDHKKKK